MQATIALVQVTMALRLVHRQIVFLLVAAVTLVAAGLRVIFDMTHISKDEAFEIYALTKMPQDASPDDIVYLLCNAAIERYLAKLERVYELGWRKAADWALRDDLLADIDSPIYQRERDAALQSSQPEPSAKLTINFPDGPDVCGTCDGRGVGCPVCAGDDGTGPDVTELAKPAHTSFAEWFATTDGEPSYQQCFEAGRAAKPALTQEQLKKVLVVLESHAYRSIAQARNFDDTNDYKNLSDEDVLQKIDPAAREAIEIMKGAL